MPNWTTGTSASGYMCVSTDQVPWSMPQLSASRPTQRGLTTSATSAARSGGAGARVRHRKELVGEAEEVVDRSRARPSR